MSRKGPIDSEGEKIALVARPLALLAVALLANTRESQSLGSRNEDRMFSSGGVCTP